MVEGIMCDGNLGYFGEKHKKKEPSALHHSFETLSVLRPGEIFHYCIFSNVFGD